MQTEAGPSATPAPAAPVIAAVTGVFTYSLSPVLVRASDLSGAVFAFWRMLLAVPVLALAALAIRRWGNRPDRAAGGDADDPAADAGVPPGGAPRARGGRAAWWLPVAGGVALAANQVGTMSALKLTSVANVALISTLSPLVVAGLGVLLLRESQRPMFWLWTPVAMGGAMYVAVAESHGLDTNVWGMVLALVGVVTFAAFMLTARHSERGLTDFLLYSTTTGAVVLAAFVLVTGADVTAISTPDLIRVLVVVLGSGTVGHWLFTWSLRATSTGFGALMRLLQPVMAGLLAWVLLAEAVTPAQLLGGAVILGGVTAVVLDGRRQPPPLVTG